ncbi:hypothetical protein P3W45_001087 [Vairimorpha bombi]
MNKTYNSQANYSQADLTQMSFIKPVTGSKSTLSKKYIFIYILALIASLSLGVLIYFGLICPEILKDVKNKGTLFMYKIFFYITSFVCMWIFISLGLMYIQSAYVSDNSFFELTIRDHRMRIILVSTLSVVSIIITVYENIFKDKAKVVADKDHTTKADIVQQYYIVDNFSRLMLGIAIVMLFMLIRRFILDGTNYIMNKSNYYQKVVENNDEISQLFLLNSVTGKDILYKSEKWIKSVFRKLSPEGHPITSENLNYFFSKEDSQNIMNLFDLHKNNRIPEDQFISVWLEVLRNKDEIKELIHHKDTLTEKLGRITMCIFLPFSIFAFMTILESGSHFKEIITVFLGCVLPLSFIFGSVLGDLFKSIIFVFLVRPFEIGDLIEFNDKKYKVEEIGLMYSTFSHNSLSVTIQNNKIMDSHVINYRLSKQIQKSYRFKYNVDVYKENYKLLQERIRNLVKSKSYTFQNQVSIKDVGLLGQDMIEFSVIVFVNIHSVNYEEEPLIQTEEIVHEI